MEIEDWRKQIDELNQELIVLLNRRARCATEIGKIKKQKGLPVLDASRESAVLNHVGTMAKDAGGPFSEDSIKNIFKTIMEETRKVEI